MARHHRADDDGRFDTIVSGMGGVTYDVTADRTTDHFHEERHDDKYLPDGWKPVYTNRIGADGGIQYPKRVAVDGREVAFTYEDVFGEKVDTGEIVEVNYDADAERVVRFLARVHYDDAPGNGDIEGFDVTHVVDLTGDGPTHVTCWLNRKSDNDDSHDGNTHHADD
jgi:hypothetical protein